MKKFSITRTIARGVALAMPLAVILYILLKVIGVFIKIIAPVAKKEGIANIFGELTLTILAVLCLFVIFFLLGLLMRLAYVASFRLYIEDRILYFIPSLHHIKMLAEDKLQTESTESQWKAALVKKEGRYFPAYIIEENTEWITFVRVEVPTTKPGKFYIAKQAEIEYIEITLTELRQHNKGFGKGYIDFINAAK